MQLFINLCCFIIIMLIRYRLLFVWWPKEGRPPTISASSLRNIYPEKAHVFWIYSISLVVAAILPFAIFGGLIMLLSSLLGEAGLDNIPHLPIIFFTYLFATWELIRGLITIFCGVDNVNGFFTRGIGQTYLVDEQIQQLGYWRIASTLLVMLIGFGSIFVG